MLKIYTFLSLTILQSSKEKWAFRQLKNKTLGERPVRQFCVLGVCKSARLLKSFMICVWIFLQRIMSLNLATIQMLGLNETNERLKEKRRIKQIRNSNRKIEDSWKLRKVYEDNRN